MTHDPLFMRYGKYFLERFHPAQFFLLTSLLATSLLFGVGVLTHARPSFSLVGIATLALFLFLLRLRIFDEFKDSEHDGIHYPNRPVPRGLVSTHELRMLLVAVYCGEFLCLLFGGPWTLFLFSISFGYSLFMYKEFFISPWLKKHFTAYILSHEILVIPLFCFIASFGFTDFSVFSDPRFGALLLYSGMQMFLLEVARKIRSKEHENSSRDTYSAQYGLHGAGALVFFVSVLSLFGIVLFEKHTLGYIGPLSAFGFLCHLGFWIPIAMLAIHPTARNAKRIFGAAIFLFSGSSIGFILFCVFQFL